MYQWKVLIFLTVIVKLLVHMLCHVAIPTSNSKLYTPMDILYEHSIKYY